MHSPLRCPPLDNKVTLMANWAWDASSGLIILQLAVSGEGV